MCTVSADSLSLFVSLCLSVSVCLCLSVCLFVCHSLSIYIYYIFANFVGGYWFTTYFFWFVVVLLSFGWFTSVCMYYLYEGSRPSFCLDSFPPVPKLFCLRSSRLKYNASVINYLLAIFSSSTFRRTKLMRFGQHLSLSLLEPFYLFIAKVRKTPRMFTLYKQLQGLSTRASDVRASSTSAILSNEIYVNKAHMRLYTNNQLFRYHHCTVISNCLHLH